RSTVESEEMQILLEFMLFSLAQSDGAVDELALRALIELMDNGVGDTRIQRVVDLALERGKRFSKAIQGMRDEPNSYKGMGALFSAVDTITALATRLAPQDQETFDEWLTRVAETTGVSDEEFRHLLSLTGRNLEMSEVAGSEEELETPLDEM